MIKLLKELPVALRRVIYIGLFLYCSLVVLPKFCYRTTGHFWLQTILSERSPEPHWATPLPSANELKQINTLLSQPYRYLGGGMQSFVFLSEDKTTVIKFFKHRTSILKKGRFRTHTPALGSIFEGYKIAYKHLKEETGVFYIHLNKTKRVHPILTLIDKIGVAHKVELDETEFVLQKRGDLICPKLRELMESKDIDRAKQRIESLVRTYKNMYARGVKDNDGAFRRNVGFIGENAALLDAGALMYDQRVLSKEAAQRDLLQKGINLEKWLMKNYPQLYDHYLERINLEFGGSHEA